MRFQFLLLNNQYKLPRQAHTWVGPGFEVLETTARQWAFWPNPTFYLSTFEKQKSNSPPRGPKPLKILVYVIKIVILWYFRLLVEIAPELSTKSNLLGEKKRWTTANCNFLHGRTIANIIWCIYFFTVSYKTRFYSFQQMCSSDD